MVEHARNASNARPGNAGEVYEDPTAAEEWEVDEKPEIALKPPQHTSQTRPNKPEDQPQVPSDPLLNAQAPSPTVLDALRRPIIIIGNLLPFARSAVRCLRPLLRTQVIKCLLVVWLTLVVLPWLINLLVAPLCNLPVVSSQISYCASDSQTLPFSPDLPGLMGLQGQLESVMEESISSSIAAVDMKRSELAVRDLATLVEQSSLVAKDSLAKNLNAFAQDAKAAGQNLQKFSSRVGGAVEEIVGLNEYVLLLLQQAAQDVQPQVSSDPAQHVLNALLLSIPSRLFASRKEGIEAAWYKSTGIMKSTVERLIHECKLNKDNLDRLEVKLGVINGMVVRENAHITKKENDVLHKLWTKLGKKKGKLRDFKPHKKLLKGVQKNHRKALSHVTRALLQLEIVLSELEALNKQVSNPALTQRSGIPIKDHWHILKKGTERLREGKKRARERENKYLLEPALVD